MFDVEVEKMFDYENGFYLTSPVGRFSKFVTHLELLKKTIGLSGSIVECGVFKGASLSKLIKFRSIFDSPAGKKVIAFDTFGEFPEAGFEGDIKKRNQFVEEAGSKSIDRDRMIEILEELNLYENIDLVEGDILQTVPQYLSENPHLKISLLHIDVDLYEPTKVCLEQLYPFVVRGGIIILDDYGAFAGANKAIDEYFADNKVRIQKLPYSDVISYVEVQ